MQRAIARAKRHNRREITPDDLLVGLLQTVARFNVAEIGPWIIDLEELDATWEEGVSGGPKVKYSVAAVGIFDRAAAIARRDGNSKVGVVHLLAAFGYEPGGLMETLRETLGFSAAHWRAALAQWQDSGGHRTRAKPSREARAEDPEEKSLLSPDEAAQLLGVHTQTIRGYIRSGRLPAYRLAGERALRIKREDLFRLLEPFSPE